MFALMPKQSKTEISDIEAAADALRAELAAIAKPARVISAEGVLMRARGRRVEAAEAERAAIREFHSNNRDGSIRLPPEIEKLRQDLAEADAAVRDRRQALAAERAAWAASLPPLAGLAELQAAMSTAADQLAVGAAALGAAHQFAVANEVPLTRFLDAARHVGALVAELRRTLGVKP